MHEPDYEDIHTRNMEAREMDHPEPRRVPVTRPENTWTLETNDKGTFIRLHGFGSHADLEYVNVGHEDDPDAQWGLIPANLESAELLSDLLD